MTKIVGCCSIGGLLKNEKLEKKIKITLNYAGVDLVLCMDYAKFII